MRTAAPALLPVFRSQLQGELLARLLLKPDAEFTLTELANDLDVPKTTIQGEVQRLIDAHLLNDRRQGRNRLIKANHDHPATSPLTQLALLSFGPHRVIAEEFGEITGADQVVIFGSWAARYAGQAGPPPNDIDVLVIGETSRLEVFAAAERAESRIHTPVNPQQVSLAQWNNPADIAFLIEAKHRPWLSVYTRQAA